MNYSYSPPPTLLDTGGPDFRAGYFMDFVYRLTFGELRTRSEDRFIGLQLTSQKRDIIIRFERRTPGLHLARDGL